MQEEQYLEGEGEHMKEENDQNLGNEQGEIQDENNNGHYEENINQFIENNENENNEFQGEGEHLEREDDNEEYEIDDYKKARPSGLSKEQNENNDNNDNNENNENHENIENHDNQENNENEEGNNLINGAEEGQPK